MLGLLVAALLAQTPPPVAIQDPNGTTKAKVVTTSGGALQVSCVGGTCSGSGGSAQWTIVDGGVVQLWDGVDKAQVTATAGGALQVECVGGTCGSAAPFADSSAFTFGTTSVANSSAVVDDVATNTVAENSAGAPRMSTQRGLHVNLRNVAGTEVGTAAAPLRVDPTGTTPQPVSGTVTTSPPANASTNVAQFGGNAVATGTGVGGVGIPRVTLSSDSSLAANQSTNLAQVAGVATATGNGTAAGALRVSLASDSTGQTKVTDGTDTLLVSAAGAALVDGSAVTQPVSISAGNFPDNEPFNVAQINGVTPLMGVGASGTGALRTASLLHDGTTVVGVIAATTALKADVASIAGTATSTAAAGVQKVGIVGNANAAIDAANNAAAPANVFVAGIQLRDGTTATAGTVGQVGSPVGALDHVLYVRNGGPVGWSCFVPVSTTALTECRSVRGAGIRAYVTSVSCSNGAATVQGVDVVFGTGSACGTGTTALTHKYQMGTNATTTSPMLVNDSFGALGLVPTAATAICVRPTNATAFGCTLTGYDAP